ncbi:hypothetical protein [Brevibacillus daliensis]|nr:hypothetical protein [Brevibacillus daliensis]
MKRHSFVKNLGEYVRSLTWKGKLIWVIVLGYITARIIQIIFY